MLGCGRIVGCGLLVVVPIVEVVARIVVIVVDCLVVIVVDILCVVVGTVDVVGGIDGVVVGLVVVDVELGVSIFLHNKSAHDLHSALLFLSSHPDTEHVIVTVYSSTHIPLEVQKHSLLSVTTPTMVPASRHPLPHL